MLVIADFFLILPSLLFKYLSFLKIKVFIYLSIFQSFLVGPLLTTHKIFQQKINLCLCLESNFALINIEFVHNESWAREYWVDPMSQSILSKLLYTFCQKKVVIHIFVKKKFYTRTNEINKFCFFIKLKVFFLLYL